MGLRHDGLLDRRYRRSGPGINGGLLKRSHANYSTVNTINVEDVDATLYKVKVAGGPV
ncbi:MAG: hypothetical protein JO194_04770, partial [Candidatus Eremiobacteraeota bacterium]|nr:hypothetical protein [Candidatus Eremiobacteraeota bacterium]